MAVEVYNQADYSAQLDRAFKYELPVTSRMEVTAANKTLTANGVATSLITIKLLDQYSAPIWDETVDLVTDLDYTETAATGGANQCPAASTSTT